MVLLCFLGFHKPASTSLARAKQGGYQTFCETCALPLEREEKGRWRVSEGLAHKGGGRRVSGDNRDSTSDR